MPPTFDQLLKSAKEWAELAAAEHWLPPHETRAVAVLEHRTPASLFEAGTHRPLVAAFFGGTGVGKSTLLNRLAGQSIAETGVERPTSREVSVYLHESVPFRHLPEQFPLDRVRRAYHHDERLRQVLWLDMPDIDSIEQHNRELVLDWLPHVDVLIYVVSPERYRDDKGWRLLQAHGGEHAWLFVINHWDRGHPAQYEDFAKLLVKAGFRDPIILRTDCREPPVARPDDFERLQGVLREMADRHVLRQLELRAEAARLQALRAALLAGLGRLGDEAGYAALREEWAGLWGDARTELLKGLEWPIQRVARDFVGHEANPLRRSIDLSRDAAPETRPERPEPHSLLWDEWAQSRLRDALDRLAVEAGDLGLPILPLKEALDELYREAGRLVITQGQLALRQALAHPGNTVQRLALKISGALVVVLPLAAIGWASYRVVKGYYESALHHLAYLGTDFAIHSALLIVLAWLLPFFVYRTLKPSAERTAIKGLRAGLAAALDQIGENVALSLAKTQQRREAVRAEGCRLERLVAAATASAAYRGEGLLERVLPAAAAANGREPGEAHSIRSK